MKSPLHSIRWSLQLWHALILLLAIGALCSVIHRFQWENDLRRIDRELGTKERDILFGFSSTDPRRPGTPQELYEKLRREGAEKPVTIAMESPDAFFSFRDRDGKVLLQSSNVPPDAVVIPVPAVGFVEESRTIGPRREVSRSAEFGLRAVTGRNITPELDQHRRFGWALAATGLGVWAVGLLGGWWLAGRAIRPIQTISRTATRIAEGNLEERITEDIGAGELRELGGVLNRTFDRLRHTLERQRQFTADAAHELRTPITILAAETQRILKRERTSEEYRAAIETCAETTVRMRRLVEDLLLLARQESAAAPMESCDLAVIAQEAMQQLTPLATEKGLVLKVVLQRAPCLANASNLRAVAANLIGNAIQHHDRAGGTVTVFTEQWEDSACLVVGDDGPGIAAEDLPHVFDRFYRADKARTATSSHHSGLGLAIVKTIVDAAGGAIECESSPGHGAMFVVALPVRGGEQASGVGLIERYRSRL